MTDQDLHCGAVQCQAIPLPGGILLRLTGCVDYHGAPEMRRLLLAAVGNHRSVLVDLGGVTTLDSAAIACLVETCQETRKAAGRFGLLGVGEWLLRALHLSRLDQVFPRYDSLEQWLEQ